MENIKSLLGDAYKEGMTLEEVNRALEGKKLVDLSTGEYVSKGKYDSLETKYKNLQSEHSQVVEQTKDYETLKSENENFKKEKATADLNKKLTSLGFSEKHLNYVKMDIDSKSLEIGDDEKVNKTNVEKYLKEHPEFAATKPSNEPTHKAVVISTGSKDSNQETKQTEINQTINTGIREALGLGGEK